MNTTNVTNKMDCIFYFIVKHETRRLKEEAERKIAKKFASVIGFQNYVTMSGPYLRSALFLKKQFERMNLHKIMIIFIDKEKDDISLLCALQRDIFVEKILASTSETDTVNLIEDVIRETESEVVVEKI